jgi:Transposase DDE domain
MNNKDIEWRGKKLEQVREEIESGQLNGLRELLPNGVIKGICEECGYYFRTRLLTPLITIFHMISAGINREGSFQSAWQMSGQVGRSGVLSEARKRLPMEIWNKIHQWMMNEIEKENGCEKRWRGHRMIGIDGTCVSMSDEVELVKHFGRWNSKHGEGRFPNARMVVAFNLQTLINISHKAGSCQKSEKELCVEVMKGLGAGDVVVFDRYYAGANLYAQYKRAGVDFIGRAHTALAVEHLKIVEDLGAGDLIVEMQIDSRYRRQDASLPESIQVRIIQTSARIEGKRENFWIVTSLLDAVKYPKQEIQGWQKKRWRVETLIEEMKIWLGVDVLRSKSVEGIYKELYARIIGLNLIHWLILKAAKKHEEQPECLSVLAALRLAGAYSQKMSVAPAWRLPFLYDQMLERIAASKIPERPNRLEPRMKKRKPKDYPTLRIPRVQWRHMQTAAA